MVFSWERRSVIAALALFVMHTPASADNYADCVAGYQRYNEKFAALQKARGTESHSTYCNAIAAERGYAACEAFIRSGAGTPERINWAKSVSSGLVAVYKECKAQ